MHSGPPWTWSHRRLRELRARIERLRSEIPRPNRKFASEFHDLEVRLSQLENKFINITANIDDLEVTVEELSLRVEYWVYNRETLLIAEKRFRELEASPARLYFGIATRLQEFFRFIRVGLSDSEGSEISLISLDADFVQLLAKARVDRHRILTEIDLLRDVLSQYMECLEFIARATNFARADLPDTGNLVVDLESALKILRGLSANRDGDFFRWSKDSGDVSFSGTWEELSTLASQLVAPTEAGAKILVQNLGLDSKWMQINRAIWRTLAAPKRSISLFDVDSIAGRLGFSPDEVLMVLALLARPSAGLIKIEYLDLSGDTPVAVPVNRVVDRLRDWRRGVSSDETWRQWAQGIQVTWIACNEEITQ